VPEASRPRRLLFHYRGAPYQGSLAREALDAALAASAFDLPITLLFEGDGVWQLVTGQDSSGIGEKRHGGLIEALPMFEIEDLRVHGPSLEARGLGAPDLLVPVTVIDDAALRALFAEVDQVLSFR
jgi:tRNA 2-thiouridine synthesizing protein C